MVCIFYDLIWLFSCPYVFADWQHKASTNIYNVHDELHLLLFFVTCQCHAINAHPLKSKYIALQASSRVSNSKLKQNIRIHPLFLNPCSNPHWPCFFTGSYPYQGSDCHKFKHGIKPSWPTILDHFGWDNWPKLKFVSIHKLAGQNIKCGWLYTIDIR